MGVGVILMVVVMMVILMVMMIVGGFRRFVHVGAVITFTVRNHTSLEQLRIASTTQKIDRGIIGGVWYAFQMEKVIAFSTRGEVVILLGAYEAGRHLRGRLHTRRTEPFTRRR